MRKNKEDEKINPIYFARITSIDNKELTTLFRFHSKKALLDFIKITVEIRCEIITGKYRAGTKNEAGD